MPRRSDILKTREAMISIEVTSSTSAARNAESSNIIRKMARKLTLK